MGCLCRNDYVSLLKSITELSVDYGLCFSKIGMCNGSKFASGVNRPSYKSREELVNNDEGHVSKGLFRWKGTFIHVCRRYNAPVGEVEKAQKSLQES